MEVPSKKIIMSDMNINLFDLGESSDYLNKMYD